MKGQHKKVLYCCQWSAVKKVFAKTKLLGMYIKRKANKTIFLNNLFTTC